VLTFSVARRTISVVASRSRSTSRTRPVVWSIAAAFFKIAYLKRNLRCKLGMHELSSAKRNTRYRRFFGLLNNPPPQVSTKICHLITIEQHPALRSIALLLRAFFGSTYLCEAAFSQMKIIKSRYRSRLTDEHLKYCLHLCLSNF
jgi:hypothetical protein